MSTPSVVLAVAGVDSGGAAGLTADVATLSHFGVHAACVVTAVTAQDTTGVHAVEVMPEAIVVAQLDAVLADLPVAVAKIGMLASRDVAEVVTQKVAHLTLVVDPVLVATSGSVLSTADVAHTYVRHLLPAAAVTTPNLAEARALAGRDGNPADLAAQLADLGCAVVLTGGPQWSPGEQVSTCIDWFCLPGERPQALTHRAVTTTSDHGTGCTFSSALAALLAQNQNVPDAAAEAAAYVTDQLLISSNWNLGRGRGPIAHLAPTRKSRPRTPDRQHQHGPSSHDAPQEARDDNPPRP